MHRHSRARRLAATLAFAVLALAAVLAAPPARALAQTGNEYDSLANATYDAGATKGQLALFVTFAGTGNSTLSSATALYDGNNLAYDAAGTTRWSALVSRIDGMGTGKRTFRDYLYTISGGACNVKTYFPQTNADGTYTALTLPRAASAYVGNDDLLMTDIASTFAAAFPSYDASAADKDNDSYLDNVMVIANSSGIFTSHANAVSKGLSIGSKQVYSMTVLEGLVYQSGSSVTDAFSESTAVHEFMHRLGAADLYRNSKYATGNPVNVWDVMASGAAYSWPLAYTRQVVGWDTLGSVDLDNLATTNTFTLSAHQGLKLVTSQSSTEYFVMEYRKDTTDPNGYDRHIGASGLIVYRVNEAYKDKGNIAGNDYVYVFRPGETSATASAGNVFLAPIATEAYSTSRYTGDVKLNQSIGSTDLSATVTDGTIFYSSGANSGIKITAVSQTDDSITVRVEMASASAGDFWEKVGSASDFSAGSDPSTQIIQGDSNLYLLVGGSGSYSVRKFADGAWTDLGSLGTGASARIAWHGGALYAAVGTTSGTKVMKWGGSAWSMLATIGSSAAYYVDISSLDGSLYVASDSSGKVGVYKVSESGAIQVGGTLPFANACWQKLALVAGKVSVVAGDTGNWPWTTYVCSYSDDSWAKSYVLDAGGAANSVSVAMKDGSAYIYTGSSSIFYEHKIDASGTLVTTDVTSSLSSITQGMTLTAGSSYLYIAGVDGSSNLIVYSCAWGQHSYEKVGATVYTGASASSVTSIGSKVYVAAATSTSNLVVVRMHDMVSGDVSADAPNQNVGTFKAPIFVGDARDVVYDGKEHKIVPRVTNDMDELLTEGTDYTVSFSASNGFVNAGTVTVTIAGAGTYGGSETLTYRILPRTVTLESASAEKTYDGTALTASGVTIGGYGFVEGEATVTAIGAQTDVGTSANTIRITGTSAYKESNYDITKTEGTLKVTAGSTKWFTVGSLANVKYDGKDHKQTPVVTGSDNKTLVAGTDFDVSWSGDVRNAGTVTVTVTGKNGYTGTKSVTYSVTKRSVTLTSQSASKKYDGAALTSAGVTVSGDGFVSGEASIKATGSVTDAGSSTNTISVTGSYNASNYVITKSEGTLTVTKRSVTLTSQSASKKYDGTALTAVQVTVGGDGFVSGEAAAKATGSVTDVGSARNAISVTGSYKASNYDIRKTEGTLTVTKRNVTLTSQSASKEYDGKALTSPSVTVGGDGFVSGEASAKATGSVTKPGSAANTIAVSGSYKPQNYDVTKNEGALTVTVPSAVASYRTHVQNVGWQSFVTGGATSGTSGRSLRLEGIEIKVPSAFSGSVQYRTHVQNVGWQDWVSDGAMSGTSGRSLRLEAIEIRLTGELEQYYDVYYRVHAQNVGWMDWAKNGEAAGTAGYSYRLEAIQIVLVKKGSAAPGSTSNAFKGNMVRYRSHVQNIGWQSYVGDGGLSGTSGRSLRLEAMNLYLTGTPYSGGIRYRTHVQNIGWQGWVSDGAMTGTSGRSLRLEAIQIELTGDMAKYFDVYYRVHAQRFGWMGWAKNGESAGTAGYSYRLESLQVVLVPKGSAAPGSTANAFRQR